MRGLKFVAVVATVLIAAPFPSFAAGEPPTDPNVVQAAEPAADDADKTLGSDVNDWVFTTVPSCPLLDTRAGSGVQGDGTGPINPGTPYSFNVKGLCGIPAEAKAVAVNFIAIGAPGNGNLRVWPWDATIPAQPNTAIITYTAGFNTSNAGDIGICNTATATAGVCVDDLFIQTNVNSAHVKADVFGYFAAPVATTPECTNSASTFSVNGFGGTFVSNVSCPAGYNLTGSGWVNDGNIVVWQVGPSGGNNFTTCRGQNGGFVPQPFTCIARCCRVPGR